MNYKLIAYSQDFASFLIEKLDESDKIRQIILFGSISRGEEGKNSDIDIFVDVSDAKLESKIEKIKEKFYESVKVKKYWQLLGIENEINCSVGRLEEWEELQKSIILDGIILFGKYQGNIETKQYSLFLITPGKSRNKNLSIWRSLYGYSQKIGKKVYKKKGIIKDYEGEKLAKGVFIIPLENTNKIALFLKKNKFDYKTITFLKQK